MNGTKFVEKYFFLSLLIASLILVLVIIFPFLTIIIMGIALSVVLYPVFAWFKRHLPGHSSWLAATLTLLLFLVVIGGPLLILGSVVFNQFQNLYTSFTVTGGGQMITSLNDSINALLPRGFSFNVAREVSTLIASLSGNISGFFTATISTILHVILVLFTLFYFLKDGQVLKKTLLQMSPLDKAHSENLLETLSGAVNAIIKGYLLIAVAQGLLMGAGLAMFGVPHPALWGVVAGVASLVPMVGTAFVSVPAVVYLLISGATGDALGLALWAVGLVGTIDNFLNPLIIGKRTDLPPLVILFAVLGGIAVLGPVGILIGPLAVSLLRALVVIYRDTVEKAA